MKVRLHQIGANIFKVGCIPLRCIDHALREICDGVHAADLLKARQACYTGGLNLAGWLIEGAFRFRSAASERKSERLECAPQWNRHSLKKS